MKFYNIEKTIRFEVADNRLTNISSQESVEISLLASRVLQLLLSSQGQVVTRDIIFSQLFDKLGASSTNNNLNQYILNLRKDLKFLQLDKEVIQTIPRIGFMIPEGIEISEEDDFLTSYNNNDFSMDGSVKYKVSLLSSNGRYYIFYNSVVIILLLVLGVVHFHKKTQSFNWADLPKQKLQILTSDSPCNIIILPTDRSFGNADVNYYSSIIDNTENMLCPKGGKAKYYFSESLINPYNYRIFILRCPDKSELSAGCYSIYKRKEI